MSGPSGTSAVQHTAVNGVGLLVRDFDTKFLLYCHDYLHRVEAVEAEIVVEVGGAGNLQQSINLPAVLDPQLRTLDSSVTWKLVSHDPSVSHQ